MRESDRKSSSLALVEMLTAQVNIYTNKAAVMGSGLASLSRETGRDMLNTLKALAENKDLDETSRAAIQKKMPALEAKLNVEYELRSDKQNGVHAVPVQSKPS